MISLEPPAGLETLAAPVLQQIKPVGAFLSMQHLSREADPEKFQDYLALFQEIAPNCPHNRDAAETMAKPPKLRGWQQTYVTGVVEHLLENHQVGAKWTNH